MRSAGTGGARSVPAGTRRCQGRTSPRPLGPVTVEHLVQLLPDEPLDLVVIHQVSLGAHRRSHCHRAQRRAWGACAPASVPTPSLPSSPGALAALGCPRVPVSRGDPSLPRVPLAPPGLWSHFSLALLACQLCPSRLGNLSPRGIQLHPAERKVLALALPPLGTDVGCQDGCSGTSGLSPHLLPGGSCSARLSWGTLERQRGAGWQ